MDELVYQSKKWTIIHISSIARAKELLTIDGLSAVSFEEHNLKYSASAKVHVDFNGPEMAGYVLASSEEGLKVQLTDNRIFRVSNLQWNEVNFTYDFHKAVNCARMKQFVPIHFAVNSSGEVKITLNRFTVDLQNNFIYQCRS